MNPVTDACQRHRSERTTDESSRCAGFFGWILVVWLSSLLLSGCRPHFTRIEGNALHLYFRQPDARQVKLHCSFDGYRARVARKVDNDTWESTVPLGSDFTYFYIVDGKIVVPPCDFRETDDFGSENCIFQAPEV